MPGFGSMPVVGNMALIDPVAGASRLAVIAPAIRLPADSNPTNDFAFMGTNLSFNAIFAELKHQKSLVSGR